MAKTVLYKIDIDTKSIEQKQGVLIEQTEKLKQEQKELRATVKKGGEESGKAAKELGKVNAQLTKNNKEIRTNNKILSANKNTLGGMRAELSKMRAELEKVDTSTAKGRKRFDNLSRSIAKTQSRVNKLDERTKNFRNNVGNYAGGIKKAFGQITLAIVGVVAAFRLVSRVGGKFLDTIVNFERAMAEVQAITGATSIEFKRLEQSSLALGESTEFTATQVAALEKEYAKLGFSVNEIINATEATLDLALATGSELAEAAATAGATLRGFGIDAKFTQRVTDVMAKSFSSSALNLDRFKDSMKFIAPIAKKANISLEQSTAALSLMADAGIRGSMAGTGLRVIISQLVKSGKPFAEALKDLAEKGLDLADAEDEVGRRAQTALLVLVDQTEELKRLTIQYENSRGSASVMANIMGDTLRGSITRASSAWQGFILSLSGSKGPIRSIVDGFTDVVRGVTDLINPTNELSEAIIQERDELNLLVGMITDVNTSQQLRSDLLDKLQVKYPNYLKNLKKEEVTNRQLAERLADVNKEFTIKIRQVILEEKTAKLQEKRVDTFRDEFHQLELIAIAKERNNVFDVANLKTFARNIELIKERRLGIEAEIKAIESSIDAWLKANKVTGDYFGDIDLQTLSLEELEKKLADNNKELENQFVLSTRRVDQLHSENSAIKEQIRVLKELEEGTKKMDKVDEDKLLDKELKRSVEEFDNILKAQRLEIDRQREEGLITHEEFLLQRELLELKSLEKRIQFLKLFSAETIDLEIKLSEMIIGIEQKQLEEEIKLADQKAAIAEKEIEDAQRVADAKEKEAKAAIISAALSGIAATSSAETQEDAAKSVVNAIRSIILAELAKAVATEIGKIISTSPPWLGVILAGIGGAAVGALFNTLVPKVEKGGLIKSGQSGMVGGKRHSEGGTKYYGDDGNVVEMERGEHLAIINRGDAKSAEAYSSMNSVHGRPFAGPKGMMQDGGVISTGITSEIQAAELSRAGIIDMIRNIPIFVNITDVNAKQAEVSGIQAKAIVL